MVAERRLMTLDDTSPQLAAATHDRARWIAVVVLCLGQLMLTIDATVANVALPAIQRDLGFSQASLSWVVNGYLITFGGLLLLAGRLGDLVGRRRVFLAGLALFTLASLLCGLSQSQELLIAARCLQGVAAACASAMVLGILVTVFSDPQDTTKAVGIYTFVAVSGGSIGLLAGGALTQALSWHWIFFINLPVGIVTLVLGTLLIPDHEGSGLHNGVDGLGALLVTAAPAMAVYTIIQAGGDGSSLARTLALSALTLVLALLFVLVESRVAQPLVPLHIFRLRNAAGANAIRALFACGMYGTFFVGALYMQHVLGFGAFETGAGFVPQTLVVAVFSLFVTRHVVARFGAKPTVIVGLILAAAGNLLFAHAGVGSSYVEAVLPAVLLAGIGGGLAFMPTVSLAMSGAGPGEAGLVSGLANVAVQVGGSLGVAVLASASTNRTGDLLARGHAVKDALSGGYDLGFTLAGASVCVAVAVAAIVLRATPGVAAAPARTPRIVAEQLEA